MKSLTENLLVHAFDGWRFCAFGVSLSLLAALGCGGEPAATESSGDSGRVSATETEQVIRSSTLDKVEEETQDASGTPTVQQPPDDVPAETTTGSRRPPRRTTGLAALIEGEDVPFNQNRMPIDQERVLANGIRLLSGEHVDLYTDLPSDAEVDQLADIFDQAVEFWTDYFGVDSAQTSNWKLSGMIVQDRNRFERAGLFPDNLPEFKHGYSRGFEFWVYEQPSAYYRRHLVLHEGTHAFMFHFLGGSGPPWYSEGMAELLACHRWQDSRLKMNHTLVSKDEGPYWGRVKILRDAYAAGEAKRLKEILWYDWNAHLKIEPYGWCWAACAFFESHPEYRDRFNAMRTLVNDRSGTFNDALIQSLARDWDAIEEQWQLFVSEIDYGYDVAAAAVEYGDDRRIPPTGQQVEVSASRGWQSSGLEVESGKRYQITASGRYQVGDHPEPWWCEPNGVTIEYHRGQPLGALLAVVRPDEFDDGVTPLLNPRLVGKKIELQAKRSGVLYFRINESAAKLADNQGTLSVTVSEH